MLNTSTITTVIKSSMKSQSGANTNRSDGKENGE